MSSQNTSSPKTTSNRGRKSKQPGPSDFCRLCSRSFSIGSCHSGKVSYISTQNLFVESSRDGVRRRKLADVLCDLGFTVNSETERESRRVCSSCATKIRNTWTGFAFIKSRLEATSEQTGDHDARMSVSPHSSAVRKCSRMQSPLEVQGIVKTRKDALARSLPPDIRAHYRSYEMPLLFLKNLPLLFFACARSTTTTNAV